jgi:hypothetical protein
MKFFSPPAPLSPARARNCLLLNQFATPGLGSLMCRRFLAGAGQLGLFLTGFGLFLAWFVDEMRQFYGMMFNSDEIQLHPKYAFVGIAVAALAWLWAWVTSISLLREAKSNERDWKLFSNPPVLPRT